MPNYDTLCEYCGCQEDVFLSRYKERVDCPAECGAQTWVRLTCGGMQSFKPFWHPNLGHTPVYVESREQLRRELKSRGLQMHHSVKSGVGI